MGFEEKCYFLLNTLKSVKGNEICYKIVLASGDGSSNGVSGSGGGL